MNPELKYFLSRASKLIEREITKRQAENDKPEAILELKLLKDLLEEQVINEDSDSPTREIR